MANSTLSPARKVSTETGNRRLLKLAKFLRRLKPEKFDFCSIVGETEVVKGKTCGSVCCAIGWMPAVDNRNWKWYKSSGPYLNTGLKGSRRRDFQAAERYFAVSETVAEVLFSPDCEIPWNNATTISGGASPKEVAANIEKFVKMRRAGKLDSEGNLL